MRSTRAVLLLLGLVCFIAVIAHGVALTDRMALLQRFDGLSRFANEHFVTQADRPRELEATAPPAQSSLEPVLDESALQLALQRLSTERFQQRDRAQARRDITQSLEDSGWVVTPQPFTAESGAQGVNLIATQPDAPVAGSLVLGAHYDTVQYSPGVDDNATGVIAAIETARILGPLSLPQPLTLVFFDLEEAGLWGSQAFVAAYPDVAGAVILEMLGFRCTQPGCQRYPAGIPAPPQTTGTFLAAVGDRAHPLLVEGFAPDPRQPSTYISGPLPVFTLTVPTLGPLAPDLLRSDHVPFWRAGIGAVMLTDTAEFRNPHYHQPSDEVSTIDTAFYRSAVQLVIERVHRLLWTL
ncbi:MAG: M28 family peptidase [Elainellaceae cyanobacterium]